MNYLHQFGSILRYVAILKAKEVNVVIGHSFSIGSTSFSQIQQVVKGCKLICVLPKEFGGLVATEL